MIHIKYILIATLSFFMLLHAQSLEANKMDCDAGNAQACYKAGETYSAQGYKEKNYDSHNASQIVATLYKKSCELGYAQGCTAYAMIYTADETRDTHKDMQYFLQKACDGGDSKGCALLYMMPSGQ